MDDLVPELDKLLTAGARRVVLDNTYPTRISRGPVIDIAHKHRLPVRCRYLATSAADARFNVALRMFKRYGKMLGPDEMKEMTKTDPNLPPPIAMQRWMDSFEPPGWMKDFPLSMRYLLYVAPMRAWLTKVCCWMSMEPCARQKAANCIRARLMISNCCRVELTNCANGSIAVISCSWSLTRAALRRII